MACLRVIFCNNHKARSIIVNFHFTLSRKSFYVQLLDAKEVFCLWQFNSRDESTENVM